jgi:hypothetical protein
MILNYNKIIIEGYMARGVTPLIAYFKQNAQISKRDNFVEFADFFTACKAVITGWKEYIKYEYNKRISECFDIVNIIHDQLEENGYVTLDGERITDGNDKRIVKITNDATQNQRFIRDNGYKNTNYSCRITEAGEITRETMSTKYFLYWTDLENIEQAIQQAELELTEKKPAQTSPTKENAGKPHQKTFADYLIHPDTVALIEQLKPIFAGAKGKQVAIRLIAMREAKLIAWSDGETTQLLRLMKGVFGNIGHESGVLRYLSDFERGKNLHEKRVMVTNLLTGEDIAPFVKKMKALKCKKVDEK